MGPISRTRDEHEKLVKQLRIDINEEVEQISNLINSVGDNECDLYYLYFKLSQLNYVLTFDSTFRDDIPAIDLKDMSLQHSGQGA